MPRSKATEVAFVDKQHYPKKLFEFEGRYEMDGDNMKFANEQVN
jgi:hypothetical protein